MKRTIITGSLVLLFAAALGLTLLTQAKKVNAEVAAGNRAFAAESYETALLHYSKAQSQATGQAEPLYNAANVYYRQQALDQARQFLEQALSQPDKAIEAFIRFNLGNVAYLAKQFDAAVAQYESALRIDPSDQSAKYNLELALLQQNQQDQQENQQDQQQGQQDPQQGQQDPQQGQQDPQQGQQDPQEGQQDPQQGQSGQPQSQQPGQPNGQAVGVQPQQGLTPEQAAQLLAAIAGNSKTLLQQLQMYYYIPGITPEKDW